MMLLQVMLLQKLPRGILCCGWRKLEQCYGASLDRKVYDPKASGMKDGGLEVKCPYCKRGMTVEQACKDPNFCLYR